MDVDSYIAKLIEENTRKRKANRDPRDDEEDDAKLRQLRDLNPVAAQRFQLQKLMENPPEEEEVVPEPEKKVVPKPRDFISNVLGASSGAGSGEFHIYRTIRRRETERLKLMDEETQQVINLLSLRQKLNLSLGT
jgi:hypothetical protein